MFIDLLRARRSIRSYQDRGVEQDKIDLLVEAVLRSPSAVNRLPWEFVVVTDRERLRKLAGSKKAGSSFVEDAALAIVVCAHPQQSDVWIEDAAIAALAVHLAATDLGLGSCWVQLRLREAIDGRSSQEYVSEVLGLGEGMVAEALLAIGYPDEAKPGHKASSLRYDKVHLDRFGAAWRA
jgi:nitroreductase